MRWHLHNASSYNIVHVATTSVILGYPSARRARCTSYRWWPQSAADFTFCCNSNLWECDRTLLPRYVGLTRWHLVSCFRKRWFLSIMCCICGKCFTALNQILDQEAELILSVWLMSIQSRNLSMTRQCLCHRVDLWRQTFISSFCDWLCI